MITKSTLKISWSNYKVTKQTSKLNTKLKINDCTQPTSLISRMQHKRIS